MRTPVVVPHNPTTPEQYAKRLGISDKRFRELKAIAHKALADTAAKMAAERGLTVPEFLEYVKIPDAERDSLKSQAEPSRSKRARHTSQGSTLAAKRKAIKPA